MPFLSTYDIVVYSYSNKQQFYYVTFLAVLYIFKHQLKHFDKCLL